MQDSEISLVELCQMLWDGKWRIVTTAFVFDLFGVSYSLVLPDRYQVSTSINMGKQSSFLEYSRLDELLKENGLLFDQATNANGYLFHRKTVFETFIDESSDYEEMFIVSSKNVHTRKYIENLSDIEKREW